MQGQIMCPGVWLMKISAHAKLNIGLKITGKRPDGYHELDMVFLEIGYGDELEVKKTDDGIFFTCSDASVPGDEKNLAYKAAALMLEKYGINGGLEIHLEKHIPSGAGLGGGSSDAAAVMNAVNELYGLGLLPEDMNADAARIGADVPFFLSGGCQRAGGTGEKLENIGTFPECTIVVIKPEDVSVSTPAAYKAYDEMTESIACSTDLVGGSERTKEIDAITAAVKSGDLKAVCRAMTNDLEAPVTAGCPVISELRSMLTEEGADGAMMTGSGSAVFGLFSERADAERCMERIQSKYKVECFIAKPVTGK